MDINLVKPFIDSTVNVLSQFGVENVNKKNVKKKSKLTSNYPVTVQIGLVGDVRGNITYNFTEDSAKKIVSTMMMGMDVLEFDDMTKSALAEVGNMITGGAAAGLSSLEKTVDISPPTLIIGKNIIAWISNVETLSVEIESSIGVLELNIGLEV